MKRKNRLSDFHRGLVRLALGLLSVLLLAMASGAPALAASEVWTVGVPIDRCPVFYVDENTDRVVGIGVDLLCAAAENVGVAVRIVPIGENTIPDALDNTDYDLVLPFGSAIKSSSGAESVVSENLVQTRFTLVTEGNRSLPPLTELRVGMLRSLSGVAQSVRSLFPGIEVVMYDTMDDCVKALRSGNVDALLHNSFVWNYVLQKPSYKDLVVQPAAMFSMDFRAGTLDSPQGRERIELLNRGIAGITETRRQAVVLDHTARRLYRYDFSDYLYVYGAVVGLGLGLLAAVIAIAVLQTRAIRQKHEEKLRHLIEYDPLTGILSLNGFRKRVKELVEANPDVQYLISYNNILNFKFVNDSLDRSAGDELLRFWASRSMEKLTDKEAICRIDADRIAVLRATEGGECIARDERDIIVPVQSYFVDRGQDQRLQICSGIYILTPRDYQQIDVDRILDYARMAEKRARMAHKGYAFYNPEQWEKARQIADVVSHLPSAIENGEIQVWYQPQIDYSSGKIIGAEALVRWNHSKLGRLRPSEFIPTLEDAGQIYPLDSYVWDQVCQDLKRWNEAGHHRFVSVNLSREDIREDRNIPGRFYELAQTYGLSTDQLRIEITETAYAENPDLLIRTTVKLREFGFQVEMDDFGSGYSSLHMLKEVPVDRIKLDLKFLTSTGDPERGRIIISHIVSMVKELGMNLIAEGVENVAQAKFLYSRGCNEMQGFFFHKPMTVEEFEKLLETADKA